MALYRVVTMYEIHVLHAIYIIQDIYVMQDIYVIQFHTCNKMPYLLYFFFSLVTQIHTY